MNPPRPLIRLPPRISKSCSCALKQRVTVIIVTHNMQQAARVSDYTGFLYLGELVEIDRTEQIFENPSTETHPKTT